ncbi:UNC5C-like protein [Ornithorhynchus anatinus]|uniref:Unc-5 family C-terminal like n=1 Tax=Ornithorhynchus anatinus TaxID=9258 RepID=A0A6I8NPM8_ORNAN|nr:UNC5C-like protein [Ornithorhynchus anatinus]
MCLPDDLLQSSPLAQLPPLLLAGVPIATALLLLAQCLYWPCPRGRRRGSRRVSAEPAGPSLPSLEGLAPGPCTPASLSEAEAFYRELGTPTEGRVRIERLLHKLLVFTGREVGHRGGCLMLPDMGISLVVPPGAVEPGRMERVSLVLVWDLSDAPALTKSQALVSPVVSCGPHGTSFRRPCTLTFKHCAQLPSQARAFTSDTALLDPKDWHPVGSSQARTTRDECCIQLSHFSLYTCVLESQARHDAHKWLQLAIFCSPLASSQSHLQLRVYFLNNTPCALQWAMTNERPHGGCLRGPCQLFDFTGARGDQCLALTYLSDGWENVDSGSCQLVPHLHIWHGKCPFRSFCFRKKAAGENEDGCPPTNEIIVTMHTYQDGLQTKYAEILRFQASEEKSWTLPSPALQPALSNRLPRELFDQLQMLLEPSSVTGNDWRRLAARLGLCGMKIRFLSCQRSPAAAVLELFEEQNGSLQTLHRLMVSIERLDCASAIQDFLDGQQDALPLPLPESLAQENEGLQLDEKL